jgi:hypothetical protein
MPSPARTSARWLSNSHAPADPFEQRDPGLLLQTLDLLGDGADYW